MVYDGLSVVGFGDFGSFQEHPPITGADNDGTT